MNESFVDTQGSGRAVPIHDAAGFAAMHEAGTLASATLDYITPFVTPGTSTGELDRLIDAFMRDHGGTPATLGYRGYPKSSCISINHVVNHGIPSDDRRLKSADIVNIDVTVILNGWFGDTSRMFICGGRTSVKAQKLVDITFDSMWAGIDAVRPGATLGDVGAAIQHVAESNRFSVVRDFVGHGVGRTFHDAPEVRHYGTAGEGAALGTGHDFHHRTDDQCRST